MKRNCIFTNKPANSKFTIGSDKQNWAKSVPCTKEYLADRGDKPPTELEIRLVELFYEQELCRLRIEQYNAQMVEIRALMSKKLPIEPLKKPETYQNVELTQEDIDWMNAPMGPIEPEECPNPKCPSMLKDAPGIGPFCPNPMCDVGDGPDVWSENNKKDDFVGLKQQVERSEELTEEEEPVKVEKKKVVKKKKANLWD